MPDFHLNFQLFFKTPINTFPESFTLSYIPKKHFLRKRRYTAPASGFRIMKLFQFRFSKKHHLRPQQQKDYYSYH